VAATVLGAVLRFWGLGAQSLWYDEWSTGEAVDGGLRDLVTYVANREGIPPPYFGLQWVWVRLVGDGEVGLRSLSALAGVAAIPVAYALVMALGGRRSVARLAALLVAVNPMLVWYSQEARSYSLLALAGALSVLALVRLVERDRRADRMAWGLAVAAVVAVHWFGAFLVVAEAIAVLAIGRRRGRPWRPIVAACVPAVAVLALLAPFAVEQHSHTVNRSWISGFRLVDRLRDAGQTALVGPSPPVGRLWLAAAVVVGLAIVMVARGGQRRARWAVAALVGLTAATVGLALVAAAVGVDAVVGRYLISTLVPLVVAVAVALGAARRPWLGLAVGGVLAVVSLVAVVSVARDPALQRVDWRSVAQAVADDADGTGNASTGTKDARTGTDDVDTGTASDGTGDVGTGDANTGNANTGDGTGDASTGDASTRNASTGTDRTGDRALVLNIYGVLARPLLRYLEHTPSWVLGAGERARVEEIDVVVPRPTDRPCNLLVGRSCALVFLGVPPPEPLASGLHRAGRIELDQFTIDRYRPDRPVTVTIEDLVAGDTSGALVVVVSGGGGSR